MSELVEANLVKVKDEYLNVSEASSWATEHTGVEVSNSNILYLIKYNRIKARRNNRTYFLSVNSLKDYFSSNKKLRQIFYTKKLGDEINWHLSFDQYKESQTTKHVHRLHPYKGKFIPQLVEYFLDEHVDQFKSEACFEPGDIVLDPFCGSGTTLVQANELGLHSVGIEVSAFNALISNLKLANVNPIELISATKQVENVIENSESCLRAREFEQHLQKELSRFNSEYFSLPNYRKLVKSEKIDESQYVKDKLPEIRKIFNELLNRYQVSNEIPQESENFLERWYLPSVLEEIQNASEAIESNENLEIRNLLRLILSRVARSSRATTHFDLATLVKPVSSVYYCPKHAKICKPLFSCLKWWKRYSTDTVRRFSEFQSLRTRSHQHCIIGDSRKVNIFKRLSVECEQLYELAKHQKIRGIFTSPPYVGLIDYHEQHAYAYELFGFARNDELEIGPLSRGQGKLAQSLYVEGIADVLKNCQKFLADDFDIFLVANDRFGLYPQIALLAGLEVFKEYKRPVLNRAEGVKGAFGESIFHLKKA